ncbi:MAG TPA: MFS transporter [Hydrogenophaga sp.]|uniref:MFS transporter n=1 Tax=Hydrogenophaga sp. TaxID=1904254 RepID=UPI0008B882DD|nr:MFS transporter [Hydrogenophaga sp.]OGA75599.1 MAG: MFS transporter [Burkholderiales bacterium GWE1_65_30]OGA91039.1 MAG: MFS transporter [Burkholderiales bacterium GWF1_66_17]HAX20062.1 MFS transporter [Hydrogenophaga sp.]
MPERNPVVLAAVVVGVGVVCALHVGKLPVAIPVLQASLGLNLLQAGFLLSLVQLAGMTLGLLVGLMADHLGPRRVMLTGLGLLALGSALGGLSTGVRGLLATRVLEGLGFLLAVLPAPGLLRRRVHDPKTLARALGWWGAYMPLGTATALLCGAPLLALIGWRPVWLSLALLTLLAAIALVTQVSGDSATTTGARPLVAGRAPSPWTRVQQTLVAPGPWLVALAFFLYSGQWLAVVGFLPTIYNQAGYSGVVVGVLTALAAGINMVGNIGAGRCLARGMRPGVLLSTAYLAMALGAVVAFGAQGHPVGQYLAVLVFSGVGGLIPGTLFSLAVVLAPGEATVSTTVGWMQQFSALGQFLGPPLVAWVATQTGGWHWTWVVTGSCSLLGIALAAWLQRAWADRALR